MFAVAISYLMGLRVRLTSTNHFSRFKGIWNRWHMSLSFWFRDFVFMRIVMVLMRNKVFKNRNVTSSGLFDQHDHHGLWHGVTWYYVAYGVFHGFGLIINDAWIRKKRPSIRNERPKA